MCVDIELLARGNSGLIGASKDLATVTITCKDQ
jgi:hypothetical protein